MARPLVLLALVALGGCTYISRKAYEAERDTLDEDADGVPRADDCDDQDPAKSPRAPETPYDGLDNDCNGQDLVDVDGDGFPGVDAATYEAQDPEVPYPDGYRGVPVDCADDPAVVPNAEDVFPDPTGAIEVPYDGIDGDCQGDNDFDADRDGYVPDTVEQGGVEVATTDALATYLLEWGLDASSWGPGGIGLPQGDDCDDTDPDVHPDNAIPEVWYDGIDRDCDDHNDFDQDDDGFMPAAAQGLYEPYVARYYGTDPPPFQVDPDVPYGDCLDETDPTKVALSGTLAVPREVHPDTATFPNEDVPRDAIDADCGADNDFDGDQDAFVPDTVLGQPTLELMADYAQAWGYDQATIDGWAAVNPEAGLATPAAGDCDDDDGDRWPGALELLGDGRDQDCDGSVDTSAFGFGDANRDFDWTAPTNPEIVRLGDSYLVMAGAESAQLPNLAQEVGAALPFPLDQARGGAVFEGNFLAWKPANANLAIQGLMDATLEPNPPDVDGDGVADPVVRTVSNSDNVTTTGYTYLNIGGIEYRTATGSMIPSPAGNTFVTDPYVGLAVEIAADDAGGVFALACAAQPLPPGYLNASYFQPYATPATATDVVIDTAQGDTCFFEGVPQQVGGGYAVDFTLCATGLCSAWTVDDTPSFTGGAPTSDTWVYGDNDEGWIALIDDTGSGWIRDASGGQADARAFPTDVIDHLDVAQADGVLYAAAILGGEVWLQYGTIGNFDFLPLPFDDPSVTGEVPVAVAVHADSDRVAVAVTATTGVADRDSVGWVFLGPPP